MKKYKRKCGEDIFKKQLGGKGNGNEGRKRRSKEKIGSEITKEELEIEINKLKKKEG